MPVRLQIDRQRVARAPPLRQVAGGDAAALAAVALPGDARDQKMRLLADQLARGGDRVEARRQRAQQASQLFGGEAARRGFEQVDELPVRR